jgi:hypothetical protein
MTIRRDAGGRSRRQAGKECARRESPANQVMDFLKASRPRRAGLPANAALITGEERDHETNETTNETTCERADMRSKNRNPGAGDAGADETVKVTREREDSRPGLKGGPGPDDLLAAALGYAARGIPVFPCGADKRPLTRHGFKDAATDPKVIRHWWARHPGAMIGMPMGRVSGVFAVDLDRKPGGSDGIATWDDLIVRYSTPPTRSSRTPSTGRHLLFRYRDGIRSIPLDKLYPGIEIKAEGGYIIVEPSSNSTGSYRWENELAVAEPPPWLLKRMRAYHCRPESRRPPRPAVTKMPNWMVPLAVADAGKGISTDPNDSLERTSIARIDAALERVGLNVDRWTWFAIGCALFSELGDEDGFELWDQWSSKGPQYRGRRQIQRQWDSIVRGDGYSHTIATLFYHADRPKLELLEVDHA